MGGWVEVKLESVTMKHLMRDEVFDSYSAVLPAGLVTLPAYEMS